MPSELRQIIFTSDEAMAALRQFYQRSNQAFPKGRIENVGVSAANGCQLDCDVVDSNEIRDHVTVASEKLAAALLLYCKTRKIPVPVAARKTMNVVNGQLALCIALGESAKA
jgi:hypothetical protein